MGAVGAARPARAARRRTLRAVVLALACVAWLPAPRATAQAAARPVARRVVSLNPSLTAILVDLGARDALVGVDDFSARQVPEVAALPRVGGLYDPSLEAVAALRPDLVVLVQSVEQRGFRAKLDELGVPVLVVDPHGYDEVLETIGSLGSRVGRSEAARQRVEVLRRARDAAEREAAAARAAGRPRTRTVLVLQREPLFVAGGGSFLDDMLRAVGAENLGAALPGLYPRASLEWLIAARPEVILDAASDAGAAQAFWSRWPSLPAVREGRVVPVDPSLVTLPGPHLDAALRALASAVAPPSAGATR